MTLADRLAELTYLLSDLAADVASYATRIETDPARLATVSERRAALTALTRKYGETIDEVLAWAERSATRLLDLDHTDERIEELRADQEALSRDRAAAAATLSAARTEAAGRLGEEVTAELSLLAMPHARLVGGRASDRAVHLVGCRRGRADARRQHRVRAAPAQQGRLRRRAVPGDAGPRGRAGGHQPGADVRLRRGRRRGRRSGRGRGRPAARPSWPGPRRCWWSPTSLRSRRTPTGTSWCEKSSDGTVTSSGLTVLDDAQRERELSRMLAGLSDSDTALAHARELLEVAQAARRA